MEKYFFKTFKALLTTTDIDYLVLRSASGFDRSTDYFKTLLHKSAARNGCCSSILQMPGEVYCSAGGVVERLHSDFSVGPDLPVDEVQ